MANGIRAIVLSKEYISKQHLDRYCDEFSFRWTAEAIKASEGKRLMYREPIGR